MLSAEETGLSVNSTKDHTEDERLEDAMADARFSAAFASRSKSEFLAKMSNEIRTPLTAIMDCAELLRDEIAGYQSNGSKLAIDTIQCAGNHLLTIIDDILDLSKIEAGELTAVKSVVSLPQLLNEIASNFAIPFSKKGVDWELKLETAIPDRVLADQDRIRQILMNLVGNAAKFTLAGRVMMIARVRGVGAEALLEIDVEDTGVGMSKRQTENLFKPFFQADSTSTREFVGNGLGLSISRRLARFMGGDISLEWTEWDRGSRFRFVMPLVIATGAIAIEKLTPLESGSSPFASAPLPKLSGRILLVEDCPDAQRQIATALRKAGAEVEIVINGILALEMIEASVRKERPFQLILTDIQMPEMDGFTLAKTLRSRKDHTPIVALIALMQQEDGTKWHEAGCNDFATKPIHRHKLLEVCRTWMLDKCSSIVDTSH